jgi:hypothetical protein
MESLRSKSVVRWLHSYGPYPISSPGSPAKPANRKALISGRISIGRGPAREGAGNGVMVDPGWKRPFEDPIPLPRGRHLVTLEDAGNCTRKPRAMPGLFSC